jgi:hypothetical protein
MVSRIFASSTLLHIPVHSVSLTLIAVMMCVSLLSTLLAITLAAPSFAQLETWVAPAAGQSGTITDPSRVYCIIDDGRLEASPDCTTFTSDGAGGLEAAIGWLAVNEDSNQIEIAPGGAPAFRWQGTPKPIGV